MTPLRFVSRIKPVQSGLVLVSLIWLTGCIVAHSPLDFCRDGRITYWQEFATAENPTQEINNEDRIRVIETPILSNDIVVISLETRAPVRWWKQIQVMDDRCRPIRSPLTTEGDDDGPVDFVLRRSEASEASLFFSKAKFAGVHTGMYSTQKNLETKLGKRLLFIWEKD